MNISFVLNSRPVSVDVDPSTRFVDLLREELDLTGTHIGCDTSQCGACVVHVNGEAVKACTMFAAEADGAHVGTIEGQANEDGSLNVIQQAFQDHHGLQCGFCTPGMLMRAYRFLQENPDPNDEEIRWGMSGNLCRCTGYQNIINAVKTAAKNLQQARGTE